MPSWVIPVGIGVLVVVGILALAALQGGTSAPAPTAGLTASGRTIGNANAKITFVEFSDFQ